MKARVTSGDFALAFEAFFGTSESINDLEESSFYYIIEWLIVKAGASNAADVQFRLQGKDALARLHTRMLSSGKLLVGTRSTILALLFSQEAIIARRTLYVKDVRLAHFEKLPDVCADVILCACTRRPFVKSNLSSAVRAVFPGHSQCHRRCFRVFPFHGELERLKTCLATLN